MIRLLSGMISLFVYFSMGTVLVQAVLGGYLWYANVLTEERNQQAVEVLYGLEKSEIAGEFLDQSLAPAPHSYDDIRQYRLKITLDQDLRESSMGAGVDDLDYIEEAFAERKRRFNKLRQNFEDSYNRLRGAASNKSVAEVRDTIVSLKPDQAADQMIRMLDLSRQTGDPSYRNDMVTILKTVPAGVQKKILAEMKTPQRAPYLLEMLNQIRLGMPDIAVVRATGDELSHYKDNLDQGAP